MNWKKKLALSSSLGFGYWCVPAPTACQGSHTPLEANNSSPTAPAPSQSTSAPPSQASSTSATSPVSQPTLDQARPNTHPIPSRKRTPHRTNPPPTDSVDDIILWTNIEANCVLIGACIPTLYPLAKQIFGSAVLGGSTPNRGASGPDDPSAGIVTIGSHGKRKKPDISLFELETDTRTGSRDVILEDRPMSSSARSVDKGLG